MAQATRAHATRDTAGSSVELVALDRVTIVSGMAFQPLRDDEEHLGICRQRHYEVLTPPERWAGCAHAVRLGA